MTIFALGMYGNNAADTKLINLRKENANSKEKYFIPHGGLYDYISCPNYFCEIFEWIGYAIAGNYNLAGFGFAFMTFANLAPRALSTHQWYKDYFKDKYPKSRKAIIPFIL